MLNRYVIYSRYEYIGKDGEKTLTNWFRFGKILKTEEEANDALSKLKELSDQTDKATKLKHFYEIRFEDITQHPIPTFHFQTKGRPSKEELKRREEYYAHYWDKYK